MTSRGGNPMYDPVHAYRLLKLGIGGATSLIVGVGLIATGELQSAVAGSGLLVASAMVFGFLGWAYSSSKGAFGPAGGGESQQPDGRFQVVWLGIGLTILSGLMYLYLRYAMTAFDPMALLFVSAPLLIAGLACMGIGMWSAIRRVAPADRVDARDAEDV